MPRNYERKTVTKYTQQNLAQAVRDVENKICTYSEAEKKYKVPRSVIFHRIKGRKIPVNKMGAGRPSTLHAEVELAIENCIKARARMGYPCDKEDIKYIVSEYVKICRLKTPFKEGVPGDDWYYCFMKRHPSLTFKKPEQLQKSRKDARKPDIIYEFYDELMTLVNNNQLEDKPYLIFNADESGFATDPRKLKAIGEKGKSLSRISGGSGREQITVLATVSANGTACPPLVVFKGAAVQPRWTSEKAYPGTLLTTSANGWMEEPQFFEWFSTSFIPHIKNVRNIFKKPNHVSLLMYDGHSSHISCRIVKLAMDNNVHLIKFPSHLTDKIQPLDKCVFGPLKTCWDRKLISFAKQQLNKQDTGRLSKSKFVELLGEVWNEALSTQNIISGFRSTGMFPVDRSKFPETEFNPLELQKYKERREEHIKRNSSHEISTQTTWMDTVSNKIVSTEVSNSIDETQSTCSKQNADRIPLQIQENVASPAKPTCSKMIPPAKTPKKTPTKTPTKIIEIFSRALVATTSLNINLGNTKRQIVPRLKPVKYGEILTHQDVLKKMEETEKQKMEKQNKKRAAQITRQLKKNQKKRKIQEHNDENLPSPIKRTEAETLCQDSSDDDNFLESTISESLVEVAYLKPEWQLLRKNCFVLVDFVGGKRNAVHYKYVCEITGIDETDGDITVLGYRRHDKFATQFVPQANDLSTIQIESIIAILPDPEVTEKDRRLIFTFSGKIDVFEQ